MTADGFYEKIVEFVSFFMRVASRGRFFLSVSFAIAAFDKHADRADNCYYASIYGGSVDAMRPRMAQEVLFP